MSLLWFVAGLTAGIGIVVGVLCWLDSIAEDSENQNDVG